MDLIISVFFPAYSFKTIPEALKIIVLPAPSYNPHQQLFVEKLTDYPQVIGRKLGIKQEETKTFFITCTL